MTNDLPTPDTDDVPPATTEHVHDSMQRDGTDAPTESERTDDHGSDKPANEAARYRRRLRETEAERDSLKSTLEHLQRSEVERLAADRLSQPGDLFDIGKTDLADLIGDAGRVDPEALNKAIDVLIESRPGLGKPQPQKYPTNFGMGQRIPVHPTGPTWGDVVRPR